MSAKKKEALSREQVIDAMRYLGWITHDETGALTDEAIHVGKELGGRVIEHVMLGCDIAACVDAFRANKPKVPMGDYKPDRALLFNPYHERRVRPRMLSLVFEREIALSPWPVLPSYLLFAQESAQPRRDRRAVGDVLHRWKW